jgi:hypothetical protein
MSRPTLEVADIFRGHGPAWRQANAGHVSLGQLKVMSAIENCRTAALGGHVCAQQNSPGGRIVRTIGIARAKAKIGLQNLAYNIRRLVTLERMAAA